MTFGRMSIDHTDPLNSEGNQKEKNLNSEEKTDAQLDLPVFESLKKKYSDYALLAEPEETHKLACTIQFRLSDGSNNIRRFYSSDKIGHLYTYIASLGSKSGLSEEVKDF